jgi:hypothetical protein
MRRKTAFSFIHINKNFEVKKSKIGWRYHSVFYSPSQQSTLELTIVSLICSPGHKKTRLQLKLQNLYVGRNWH